MKFIFRALLAGLLCSAMAANAEQPIIIKFSHVVADSTLKGRAAEMFKKLAEERTAGRVKAEVYANSSLYKDKEELEAMQMGAVQMLAPSTSKFGPLGALPQVQAFSEVQKYIALSNHGYDGYVVIVNKKFWDGLPADLRKTLDQAMKEATAFENELTLREENELVQKIKATGRSTVYSLTPEETAAWRKVLLPVHKTMEDRTGKELIEAISAESAALGFK